MKHAISQAPATAELCNRLYDKLNEIQYHIRDLAKLEPNTDELLVYALVMGWCGDARTLVLEIKSQL